jgi:hypothetical protein
MTNDLEYVRARIPGYRDYEDEAARHDSDIRVRAYVGEALAAARDRLGALSPETTESFERTLLHCMFNDLSFVQAIEHATLDQTMIAALVAGDRALVELADRAGQVSAAGFPALLELIEAQFVARHSPASRYSR